jgi:hypothetical protein
MSYPEMPMQCMHKLLFFGRINYSLKRKIFSFCYFRADGSTMFASGHQWGYFPSVSAGWVASSENFMASTGNWLDFLVRASWVLTVMMEFLLLTTCL